MGNSTSKNKGEDRLAIECMARYMSISKPQLVDLRNRCYMAMDSKRKIDRRQFNINVQLCKIKESPDAEILDALFTMWDLHGDDKILCPPFLLSLAPLACRDHDLEQMLTFSFEIFRQETNGKLSADRLVFMLKHLNQTASYFGDSVLSLRQIYKVVDNVFGTMSIISHESPAMTHKQCIDSLVTDPLLQQFLSRDLKKGPRVTFSPVSRVRLEDGSEFSADTISVPLTPIARVRLQQEPKNSVLKPSSVGGDEPKENVTTRQPSRSPWISRRK